MLTPLPDAKGFSSSRLNGVIMLSIGPGCARGVGVLRFGMLWPEAVEPFRASLVSLGLAGCAAIGPLIEPLMPVLIVPAASDSSLVRAVLSPDCDLLMGDQERRLPNARGFWFDDSEVFGFAMTDFKNLLAFSRDAASLKNCRSRVCAVRPQFAFFGSNGESKTLCMRMTPAPVRRDL
jgi:hypothetical protein